MGRLLDLLSTGLLLVDSEAQVLHANRAAQALCDAQAPVVLAGQQLRLTASDRQRLEAALRQAARRQWSMVVFRQGDKRLHMAVVPVQDPVACPSLVAALVLGAGSGPSNLALQFFSQAHGLTSAEGAVLAGLCRGLRPAQIAAIGGVQVSTVRTQVAALREKTQSTNIGHLMRQVYSLPPLAQGGVGVGMGGVVHMRCLD